MAGAGRISPGSESATGSSEVVEESAILLPDPRCNRKGIVVNLFRSDFSGGGAGGAGMLSGTVNGNWTGRFAPEGGIDEGA